MYFRSAYFFSKKNYLSIKKKKVAKPSTAIVSYVAGYTYSAEVRLYVESD